MLLCTLVVLHALLLSVLPTPCLGQSWKHYPLELEDNPQIVFSDVEGIQLQDMGDSWFLTAPVIGQTTGKRYQIDVIFDRNYITAVILNFYQVSIFDYESGAFNTFTQYDLPPTDLADQNFYATPGYLDVGFTSSAGNASWTTLRQPSGALQPFTYSLTCLGTDIVTSAPFAFSITANMQKKPVAYGASTLRGNFTFYAQKNTLTYFQPGPSINGTLTFGGITEPILGTQGHIDRQIFPLYTGIDTPDGREHSHEWRQINLANGIDLAIWRQFDREAGNALIPTTGVTTSFAPTAAGNPSRPPLWTDGLPDNDLTVEYISYAKYPRGQYSTLLPPPSPNMYLPSSHIIRSKKLRMELQARYTTHAPVAELPIEYFEGPAVWNGTYDGQAVEGVGIFESTLALYRDWELATVLLNSVSHLPATSFAKSENKGKVVRVVEKLTGYVSSDPAHDDRVKAAAYAEGVVIQALKTMVDPGDRSAMLEIAHDFVESLALVD